MSEIRFSPGVRVAPDYHSGGTVVLSTCLTCGAVVINLEGNGDREPQLLHRQWHEQQLAMIRAARRSVYGGV